jgi:hypothetical protein
VPLTQFGRMCAALGIQIIAANSPQAKGRVERNHGTHQDRLVKKLRRLGIADATAANAFLERTYLPEHNARFAQAPASTEDFHRRTPSRTALDAAFQLEQTRVLSNDWVVRYATRYFQVVRQSHRPPARSEVLVREAVTGAIEIRYRGRRMQWTEIPAPAPTPVAAAARSRPVPARPAGRAHRRITRGATTRSGAHGTRSSCPRAHEEAHGRCRPRGRADAPTGPCKTRGRVSHSAHRPSTSVQSNAGRGHFYFAKNGDISISA